MRSRQMVERDKDGVYTKEYDKEGNEVTDKNGDPVKHYCTKKYNAQMKKMFDFINDNNIESHRVFKRRLLFVKTTRP